MSIWLSIGLGVYIGLVVGELQKYKDNNYRLYQLFTGFVLTVILWPIPILRRLSGD